MKFLNRIKLYAMLPLFLVLSCNEDEPSVSQPEVMSTSPMEDATDVGTDAVVEVKFNKDMNAASINATTFTLFQGSTQVEGAVSYADSVAKFTPTSVLEASKVFDVTITNGVIDATGLALENDYTFSFTSGLAPDINAPTVTLTDPVNEATDVAFDQVIMVTFSEEMDASTLDETSFTLMQGTTLVAGTVVYTGTSATLTPNDNLEAGQIYTVTVASSATDLSGLPMVEAKVWSFTTDVLPTVTSVDPLDNATDVARNKAVSVTFSEAMDLSTITTSSFILMQGANDVTGTIEFSGNMARFIPNAILDPSSIYTATVNTDVHDLGGNALLVDKVWSFTTGTENGLAVVNLRAAGNYVILAKTAINNIPTSAITGDLGLSPAATSFITGFALTDATGYATSPQVTGKVYAADMASPTSSNLTTAVENMLTAYTDAASRPTPDFLNLLSGDIGGQTLDAGLYKWGSTVTIPGDVTLSGSPDDVWIFQIDNDLSMSADVNITLTGGAQAKNIFWQVAGEVVIGANSHFEGIILSQTGITLQTGASFHGRMLAQTAIILDQNAVTKP